MSYLILPQKLYDSINSIDLNRFQNRHAFNFINYLFYLSTKKEEYNHQFGYSRIPSNYLRENFTKDYYKKFLSPLISSGVIERCPYYNSSYNQNYTGPKFSENKPFGYRINNSLLDFSYTVIIKLSSLEHKKTNQIKSVIRDIKKISFDTEGMKSDVNNYDIRSTLKVNEQITDPYIYLENIENGEANFSVFKKDNALTLAQSLGKDLVQYKSHSFITNIDLFIRTRLNDFKMSQFYSIAKITDKDFFASINNTNYRLDSTLTNLKKVFFDNGRIQLQGEKIVDIDLKNSQPTILAYLLESNPEALAKKFPSLSSYIFPKIPQDTDIEMFCQLAGTGILYDYIAQATNRTRSESKLSFIKIMFSSDRWNSWEKKIIRDLFPTFTRWTDDFKRMNGDSNLLSIMLQRLESEIFIKNIYPTLRKEHVIYTKHDSILCKESEKLEIKGKMERILDSYGLFYKLE